MAANLSELTSEVAEFSAEAARKSSLRIPLRIPRRPLRFNKRLHLSVLRNFEARILLDKYDKAFSLRQDCIFSALESAHQREGRNRKYRRQQNTHQYSLGCHFTAMACALDPIAPRRQILLRLQRDARAVDRDYILNRPR